MIHVYNVHVPNTIMALRSQPRVKQDIMSPLQVQMYKSGIVSSNSGRLAYPVWPG